MWGFLSAALISVAPVFLGQVANLNSSCTVITELDAQEQLALDQAIDPVESTAETPQPDSLCNPTLYSCTGAEEPTQVQACASAKECATESGACWVSATCYQCLQINTFPPSYQCSVYYKLP
jgi:hypothetical protein